MGGEPAVKPNNGPDGQHCGDNLQDVQLEDALDLAGVDDHGMSYPYIREMGVSTVQTVCTLRLGDARHNREDKGHNWVLQHAAPGSLSKASES